MLGVKSTSQDIFRAERIIQSCSSESQHPGMHNIQTVEMLMILVSRYCIVQRVAEDAAEI